MSSAAVVRGLRKARVGIYATVVLAILYLVWRYDSITLPEEGCSPVRSIAPGARLVIDLHPGTLATGDTVIFRAEDGELLLGVVGVVPDSAPPEMQASVADGALWITADQPKCPAKDSRLLGPIPRASIAGKVFLSL